MILFCFPEQTPLQFVERLNGINIRLIFSHYPQIILTRSTVGESAVWHDLSLIYDALIQVYDAAGNVIETHEYKGDFSNYSMFC
jgi:hypothetical protein